MRAAIRSPADELPASSLSEIEKLIVDNGGRVADLDEPKLTHVVLDKRDDSRRRELISRTSKCVFSRSLPLYR
jgi:DNA ligase 4